MSAAAISESHEHLLRPLAPQVFGLLVRRHGSFDACEDAVQEALIAAVRTWPETGVPEHPRAWLLTAASRRLIDESPRPPPLGGGEIARAFLVPETTMAQRISRAKRTIAEAGATFELPESGLMPNSGATRDQPP